jgi:hypothetical protein
MGHLSMRKLCEGNMEGGAPFWDPGGYIKEGSLNRQLSP